MVYSVVDGGDRFSCCFWLLFFFCIECISGVVGRAAAVVDFFESSSGNFVGLYGDSFEFGGGNVGSEKSSGNNASDICNMRREFSVIMAEESAF